MFAETTIYWSEIKEESSAVDEESDDDDHADVSASMVGADATDSVARSLAGASLSPDESELHFAEPWFHRIVHQGRLKAEELLRQNADLGDGTFLVRPSEMFVGSYSLSFLRKGDVRK